MVVTLCEKGEYSLVPPLMIMFPSLSNSTNLAKSPPLLNPL